LKRMMFYRNLVARKSKKPQLKREIERLYNLFLMQYC